MNLKRRTVPLWLVIITIAYIATAGALVVYRLYYPTESTVLLGRLKENAH